MRRTVINIVLAFVFGCALAAVGYPWFTWQFWLLFGLFMAVMVNSQTDRTEEG